MSASSREPATGAPRDRAPAPSATVVLLRDAAPGLELLLLQRAPRADGRPGPWVFPGGKVEASDRAAAADVARAARLAAVRETHEESGLVLAPDALVPISRWITPEIAPRRFDTWFFLGAVDPGAAVRVDGGEIVAHRWLPPAHALEAHRDRALRLAPPTFVTVTWLAEHRRAAEALRALATDEPTTFRPRICPRPEGACMLYPGDAGYEAGDPDAPGPRHRLWALADGYRYERSG